MSEKPKAYLGFARKWRPQDFADLAGQDQVGKALRAEVEKGRIGHAYIFSGPRGVGKTSSARILAKAINCVEGPTPSPCNVCENCVSITNGSNLDVIEIDGASNNSVDQVRDLRESVNHVPFSCRYKIYIIDEVHMLSLQAFNALLKTLEEPPSFVMFIFATTEPEKIPDTIKSRCQTFKFRAITLEDIVARLDYILTQEKAEIEESERREILQTIALSAEGGMRDAQVALDQVISLSSGPLRLEDVRDFLGVADQNSLFGVVEKIRDRDTAGLIEVVREMVERGRDLERYVKQVLAFLRDLLILRCGGNPDLVRLSAEGTKKAQELAQSLDTAVLVNAVNQFLDLEGKMKQGATPRFLVEFTFIRLTALEDVAAISDIIQRIESGAGGAGDKPPTVRPSPVSGPGKSSSVNETAPPFTVPTRPLPLAGGGALEPVSASNVDQLREMLVKAIGDVDISLGNSLKSVPLSRIENNVAYFGQPGQSIHPYDLRRFEKPETKNTLIDTLKRLTGTDHLTIRIGGETNFVSAKQVHAVSPAAAPVPAPKVEPVPMAMEPPPIPREITPDEAISEEGEYDPTDLLEENVISIEDARKALGKSGMSATQIRALLKQNEPLREKVELIQKIFGGVLLDGDKRPIKI